MTDRFAVLNVLTKHRQYVFSNVSEISMPTLAAMSVLPSTCTNQINSINLRAIVNNIDNTLLLWLVLATGFAFRLRGLIVETSLAAVSREHRR